ncbi:MAG: FtsX-like permease family protein [Pseudomonadota bacterium]
MNLVGLLRLISLKHVRLRKIQTLMAGGGICLGVVAIVSIGIVNRSVLHSFDESFNQVAGRASLQVTGAQSGFPETIVEIVNAVPGVEYAVPVIESEGLLVSGKEQTVMILGVDVLVDTQVRDYNLSGERSDIPDPLLFLARPDSILITGTMAAREGIVLDQKIQVQTVQGIRAFRVRGILNPTGPARAMGGNVAVMDIYAAQMAFGKEGRIDRVDVRLLRGEILETVRERILNALPKGYGVDTPPGRTRQVQTMISKFQEGFNIISFLALFAGMYLIYNAVSISVVQRRKEVGILRALGATRRQIAGLFLSETLVISIIASILGVVFGLLSAKTLVGVFGKVVSETYVRTVVTDIHVTWFYPSLGFGSGILASLAAAIFPVRASSHVSPVSAIRSVPHAENGSFASGRLCSAGALCLFISLLAFLKLHALPGHTSLFKNTSLLIIAQFLLLLGLSLFTPAFLKGFVTVFHRCFSTSLGVIGSLAAMNLRKNLLRNAVAVAAVFFGIAIFVSTAGLVLSVKESVINWVETVNRADIIVTSGHPMSSANAPAVLMPAGMGRELESVPGVLSADPWRKVSMNYNGRPILLSAVDFTRRAEYSTFPSMPPNIRRNLQHLLPNRENVAVSESFAVLFAVKPGDDIMLPTPSGAVRFGVAAVVVDYTTDIGTVLVDINTYQRHWKDMLANSFSVRVKPGTSVAEVRNLIQQGFGTERKLYVLPALAYKNEIRKVLDGMFIFNHALSVMTLTIACLGIIVALFSSVLERGRQISILRSIGMLRRQIAGVVVLESVLMGLAGGLLGAAAGIISGWINLEGLFVANYGTAARYFIPYGSIFWALVLSAGLSALAGTIPAWRAANTPIVETLGYE